MYDYRKNDIREINILSQEGLCHSLRVDLGKREKDPVLNRETITRKVESCIESVVAIFFDVEKAYDMVWIWCMHQVKYVRCDKKDERMDKEFLKEISIQVFPFKSR